MAPIHNSFRRIAPSHFVGNHQCWGFDNKEVPMRAITPIKTLRSTKIDVVSHIELKTFDHTANMFLALAAVVSCGVDGI